MKWVSLLLSTYASFCRWLQMYLSSIFPNWSQFSQLYSWITPSESSNRKFSSFSHASTRYSKGKFSLHHESDPSSVLSYWECSFSYRLTKFYFSLFRRQKCYCPLLLCILQCCSLVSCGQVRGFMICKRLKSGRRKRLRIGRPSEVRQCILRSFRCLLPSWAAGFRRCILGLRFGWAKWQNWAKSHGWATTLNKSQQTCDLTTHILWQSFSSTDHKWPYTLLFQSKRHFCPKQWDAQFPAQYKAISVAKSTGYCTTWCNGTCH